MTREDLVETLAAATQECRVACAVLVHIWNELGESGLISPDAQPAFQDASRRLFAQAKVMNGILAEIKTLGESSRGDVRDRYQTCLRRVFNEARKLKKQGADT
jgi:predicted amino acid dehydrogenase